MIICVNVEMVAALVNFDTQVWREAKIHAMAATIRVFQLRLLMLLAAKCLDMRYVHSALPNHIMSICWFLRSATISYAYATTQGKLSTAKSAIVVLLEPVLAAMKHGFAGALVYLADEAPSMQMSFWRNRIWYDEDVLDLRSVETEFPAIVFNDSLNSNETPSCEPTVSSLNNNEIDIRISFDESDDEDYKPSVSCIDDLDFFKDFENEFPAIVYNDALTSKSDFSTEPTLCLQHIDKFDLKDETSLSEYDEVEQSVLYFNDLFSFSIVYPDDLKLDKGNDGNEIDMIQSLGGNENKNKLLKESHDKIRKVFIMGSFIMGSNVNIVAWNHFVNGMLFNLI
ncbi:hypothetical protein Tco_1376220 [Tanacetum coccineum]